MKKLVLFMCLIVLLTGCGTKDMKMTTCTTDITTNGITNKMSYDIDYDKDNKVRKVIITYDYNKPEDADDNHTDGVGTGTDGTTSDKDTKNEKPEVVDGVVGKVIDTIVGETVDTIYDISGLSDKHKLAQARYDDIEGITYDVMTTSATQYKVVYTIDMDKLSDNNLVLFNLDRDYTTLRSNYTDAGLTCK